MPPSSEDISPFVVSVPNNILEDLKKRLELARLPQNLELPAADEWSYGAPTHRVEGLIEYWKHSFDWRKMEADINASLPQFTTPIDAEAPHGILRVHFVHKRSPNPNAVPLLFSHGWPGSFLEVAKLIEPLTNPSDPKDPAFHVVAPSLPGYVFSEPSKSPGLGLKATAIIFDKLMKRLGYQIYVAQGGDWGALVVKALAVYHGDSCRATHTNMPIVPAPSFLKNPILISRVLLGMLGLPGGYSKREIDSINDIKKFRRNEIGYMHIQSTKPQTLAYGLTDSPTALLAWIYEKLHSWSDAYPWTNDEILTYYKEALRGDEAEKVVTAWSNVPLGVSVFKAEVYKFPDEWHNMVQPVVFHRYHDEGGHFAAHEKPELLVEDIRNFTQIVLRRDKTLLPI